MDNFYAETHRKVYGPPECDRELFLRRIDGLLLYLQGLNSVVKPAKGFAPPPIR